jgi:hypothetical protein
MQVMLTAEASAYMHNPYILVLGGPWGLATSGVNCLSTPKWWTQSTGSPLLIHRPVTITDHAPNSSLNHHCLEPIPGSATTPTSERWQRPADCHHWACFGECPLILYSDEHCHGGVGTKVASMIYTICVSFVSIVLDLITPSLHLWSWVGLFSLYPGNWLWHQVLGREHVKPHTPRRSMSAACQDVPTIIGSLWALMGFICW